MWGQVVGGIWGTLSHISQESLTLPRQEFVQELCSAVHERDHAAFLRVLAGKAELALSSASMKVQDLGSTYNATQKDNRQLKLG